MCSCCLCCLCCVSCFNMCLLLLCVFPLAVLPHLDALWCVHLFGRPHMSCTTRACHLLPDSGCGSGRKDANPARIASSHFVTCKARWGKLTETPPAKAGGPTQPASQSDARELTCPHGPANEKQKQRLKRARQEVRIKRDKCHQEPPAASPAPKRRTPAPRNALRPARRRRRHRPSSARAPPELAGTPSPARAARSCNNRRSLCQAGCDRR